MTIIRPNRIGRRWLGLPISTPKALFNNSENGVFLDFSDPRSLYTDASGTIPVAAPGDTILLAADKSRSRNPITAYAGVQANTGLAPRYGRAPKSRRNLLVYTEQLDNAGWSKTNTTVVADAIAAPDGTITADKLVEGAVSGFHAADQSRSVLGLTETFSVYLKAAERAWACLQLGIATAYFNLATGVVGSTAGGASAAVSDAGNGWYRCSITVVRSGSGSTSIITATANNTASYAGDGTSGIYMWGGQLEVAAAATAYQRVGNAYDMTEVGFPSFGFARYDLTDDLSTIIMTLAQTGDVLLFGRNGSWIEPGRVFAAASRLQIGVTGTSVTPGILRALGDLVGIVAIGRTLTSDERDRALRYFQAAGAAGWLTLGPNLWADSGHTVTSAAWTNNGDGTFTASGGTGPLGFNPGLSIMGRQYLGKFEVVSRSGGSVNLPYDGAGLNQAAVTSVGVFQHVITAGNTLGPYIYSNAFVGTVRAVSYQLITPGA